MITEHEIKEIHKACADAVNDECERAFIHWREQCMRAFTSIPEIPLGLEQKTIDFINNNKHLFYRGYREKILDRIKSGLRPRTPLIRQEKETLPIGFTAQSGKVAVSERFSFNEHRDRLFLETYLSCNENARRAAEKLGVAKSTFHDWKQQHVELIESEKRKTCALY